MAKHAGLIVIALSSSKNIETVKKLGADHVIDYTSEVKYLFNLLFKDIEKRVKEITNNYGADFWFDVV
jgi:NADPH:quinone reductase-like Zn-dependent oxidoreductase